MKTNTPNPVDGDVQALIADCESDIKKLEVDLIAYPNHPALLSELRRQQVALAALTAVPGIFEWRFKETDCAPSTGWIAVPMERLEQAKQTFGDLVEYRFWFPTAPAQLLRPVELPHTYSPALSSALKNATDGVAVMRCDKNGKWINKTAVVEALRQQGYEVKE